MLVAADVAKSQAADEARRDLLQIQWTAPAGEYLYIVAACSDESNRPLRDKYLVFVYPRTDKDLVFFPCFIQRCAWTNVGCRIPGIHNERPASIWIRRRDFQRVGSILTLPVRSWFHK